jgi:NADH-quinone oxidoreductase subunit G
MACFSETSGSFVGIDNRRQQFSGAVAARGDSRPGWKILRVLGNISKLKGFDYISSQDVVDEIESNLNRRSTQPTKAKPFIPTTLALNSDLMLVSEVPMYRTDSLLRHSPALQNTPETKTCQFARINQTEADKHGLDPQREVVITQGERHITLPLQIDDDIADGCIYVAAATDFAVTLGQMFGQVTVSLAGDG